MKKAIVHQAFKSRDPQTLSFQARKYLESYENRGMTGGLKEKRWSLSIFIRWCGARKIKKTLQVTRSLLEDYQISLGKLEGWKQGSRQSPRSIHSRLEHLRLFFSWLAKEYIILQNPASGLELPIIPESMPEILKPEEIKKLMEQPNLKRPVGLRDRVILECFYSSGIRRQELAGLRLEDVDFKEGILDIREGKGNKRRLVPIGKSALGWIEKYLAEVRPKFAAKNPKNPSRSLFLGYQGQALSKSSIGVFVGKYFKKAGFDQWGSCHLLRHSMATEMLKNGADLRIIQEILGHAQLETTLMYTHLDIEHLKKIHAQTHPAEIQA